MFGSLAPTLTSANIYGGGVASQSAPNSAPTTAAASVSATVNGPQSPVATFVVIVLLLVGLRFIWEMAD